MSDENSTADAPLPFRRAPPPAVPGLVLLWSFTTPRYAAFPLTSSPLQIGRSASCAIALPDDIVASRRHAEISFDSATRELVIRDAASKHGTFVDGERIAGEERTSLAPHEHCVVRIGSSIFVAFGDATAHIDDARRRKTLFDAAEDAVIGPKMRAVRADVARAARAEQPLLIQGETGSGKERIARLFHTAGPRAHHGYEALNCANIERGFAESILFGHAKGAFTGADAPKDGAFVRVDGGVLFLDEIAELPLEVQPKLLRTLEDGWVHPMGNAPRVRVDVKVVAASHAKLDARIKSGAFRQDLYYRLRGVEVRVPPLRERVEEIPFLVELFRARVANAPPASALFVEECLLHPWPGNVRQLASAIADAASAAAARAAATPATATTTDADDADGAFIIDLPRDVREAGEVACEDAPEATAPAAAGGATIALPAAAARAPYTPRTKNQKRDAEFAALVDACGGDVAAAATREGIPLSTGYARVRRHEKRVAGGRAD